MDRFISTLFLFEKRLYSKVNHKIMQIDFPDAHTLILDLKNSETQNRKFKFQANDYGSINSMPIN